MIRAATAALVLGAGPALAELEVMPTRYGCERGVEIPVVYVNGSDGSAVVLQIEGRQITLVISESASGARYQWPSDGSGYVWWTKGQDATLAWFDAEKGEEVTLYAFCKSI